MKLGVVILAAGQGSRMNSTKPKVLHTLAGMPLLGHVLKVANALNPACISIVYGHGGEQVQATFSDQSLAWAEQKQQLGTGHAVMQALPAMVGMDKVLVLYGDVPLMAAQTLQTLIKNTTSDLGLLTVTLENPQGYGRIVRDAAANVLRIVEQKDATTEELALKEINTGIMLVGLPQLQQWLGQLSNSNAQGEYYLTDIIEMAVTDGVAVHVSQPADPVEAEGVNDRQQLASLERWLQNQQANQLMAAGVSFADPTRFDLRGELSTGQDVFIDINVIVQGQVTLGNNVSIGANTTLRNVTIADDVTVLENCVLEDAMIGASCNIGPFARIRPGTTLAGANHIGNFVEIKNAQIAKGSKINHLSYIGDTDMGSTVNIGAGTITCNYDGANKHRTVIGNDVFVGSNSALVAPVRINDGATIGAGSTISKDAAADKLTLTRAKQHTINNWTRPRKK